MFPTIFFVAAAIAAIAGHAVLPPMAHAFVSVPHMGPRSLRTFYATTATPVQMNYPVRNIAMHLSMATDTKERESSTTDSAPSTNVDDVTQKFGLEVGLFESLRQGGSNGKQSAQELLKKYGIAYLATSIPLALISFVICYALVDRGIDVSALLERVGIDATANSASEKAGTFAIAYAAHKAASPIRFPPTVILTPIVAKWIGKEPVVTSSEESNQK